MVINQLRHGRIRIGISIGLGVSTCFASMLDGQVPLLNLPFSQLRVAQAVGLAAADEFRKSELEPHEYSASADAGNLHDDWAVALPAIPNVLHSW